MKWIWEFKVWWFLIIMISTGGSLSYAQTNVFPPDGNVGIGTTSPSQKLHVSGGNIKLDNTGLILWRNQANSEDVVYLSLNGDELRLGSAISNTVLRILSGATADSLVLQNGNVGIGTTSPGSRLTVAFTGQTSPTSAIESNPSWAATSGNFYTIRANGAYDSNSNLTGSVTNFRSDFTKPTNVTLGTFYGAYFAEPVQTGPGQVNNVYALVTEPNAGNVGIGTTTPSARLHVAGNAIVDGNIAAKYQDVAEWVKAPASLPPGTVVVIDPRNRNQVLTASQAYDTRVAGVISAQPGILLGEAGEDRVKVAHTGRVKVRADAQYGPIEVGDLLVSSATPGHAMRSTPVDLNGASIHRPGTIVGKALEPLKEGTGEILVLLTLQ